MRPFRIATRGSKLAITQTYYIKQELEKAFPEIDISIVEVSTKGDRDQSDFLYKANSIGFFTSEVENCLLEGKADIAVHSLKDLPTSQPEGLVVAAIPKRESVADVLVASSPINSIADLPAGATVGTSSLRRISQLKHLRQDLNCQPLRGNVETRVAKVTSGQVDAIVIAHAGLNRLGLADNVSLVLPPDLFLPAPAQGALGVQIRTDDTELADIVKTIDDDNARITAMTERRVLAATHGGCSIPLGTYSRISGNNITLDAVIVNVEGTQYIKRSFTCSLDDAGTSADDLAQQLLANGGKDMLDELRQSRND